MSQVSLERLSRKWHKESFAPQTPSNTLQYEESLAMKGYLLKILK